MTASKFNAVINDVYFTDSVRERQGRVMIHCQAGVSRSSTIAIAYIMARSSLGMIDAFRFVKSRRSIVAPNFNFLGQLLDFESALKQGLVASRPDLDVSSMIAAEYQPPPPTPSLPLNMHCSNVGGMLE
jgi:dual specificity MAP kinase phosphatase